MDVTTPGSSPPTRGTQRRLVAVIDPSRFIPAHAGNTWTVSGTRPVRSVHPRPRGEHFDLVLEPGHKVGSSPPTRGTPIQHFTTLTRARFIPAHAGNTLEPTLETYNVAVHPRPRGEHFGRWFKFSSSHGSSPPTRGTRYDIQCQPALVRFIPAHAGNTVRYPVPTRFGAVHPRPRGEHCNSLYIDVDFSGSSPPTRGTRPGA